MCIKVEGVIEEEEDHESSIVVVLLSKCRNPLWRSSITVNMCDLMLLSG